ncbi:fumarylacetoacetate hydrolase family protein [Alteribacillus sp. HJP-4]|uniref:fumarylacetoacetate hydrolase family protein n=1 Tax=Alteribacillus sp. HJP-4 TaxID=2775394 RepID=UPI0035CD183B
MKLATVEIQGEQLAAIVTENGVTPVKTINQKESKSWGEDLFSILTNNELEDLKAWHAKNEKVCLEQSITTDYSFLPLYNHPGKIWGIGLNYVEHASDLSEKAPNTEPASFMKPDTSIIGPGDTIEIPPQSERTTAEAELGVIIGKECKNVSEEEAPHVIAGFTTIIDMTAEDILQKNPRYLTRSKSFDTFFSFGPHLVTADEVEDVNRLEVATVINGEVHRKNVVSNMTFTPWNLVSFHSKVMTLKPGDIISTGTPGAVPIKEGDTVECHIDDFEKLVNNVRDLKK